MDREPLGDVLRRLQWTVLRPLARRLGGNEQSLLRGPGMELADVREYQPGDDIRHIDWNVTARSGGEQLFVREAQVERALDVWLLIDVSASIDWGTARALKRDVAVDFTAVAAELLGRHGNRVGALLFNTQPLGFVAPGAGRSQVFQLLDRVRTEARQQVRGPTDLAAALDRLRVVVKQPALVLVISDFLVAPGWQEPLQRLALRHEVVAVVLQDPRERELPDVGMITLEDPETGEQFTVNTSDRRLRERFIRAAAAQQERLQADLLRCDVRQLTLGTDRDLLPDLVQFLDVRGRRMQRRPARFPQGPLAAR